MRFHDSAGLHGSAERVFLGERKRILAALPEARVEHIGATSVVGARTKGDVDLLVRVPAEAFASAVEALGLLYAVHQPEHWSASFASFAGRGEPVGAQLVIEGSADEHDFLRFRDRLAGEPALLAEYNELKRRHEGVAEDVYRAAKGAFVRRVVRREL